MGWNYRGCIVMDTTIGTRMLTAHAATKEEAWGLLNENIQSLVGNNWQYGESKTWFDYDIQQYVASMKMIFTTKRGKK